MTTVLRLTRYAAMGFAGGALLTRRGHLHARHLAADTAARVQPPRRRAAEVGGVMSTVVSTQAELDGARDEH